MDKLLLTRLAEHQRAIEAIAAEARPLLSEGATPAPATLSRLRWQMVRALTAYQQFKHREIFDPAIARGGDQLRRMGEVLKADCTVLSDDFTRYVQDWTRRGTDAHWPEYRAAAERMSTRICRHLQREQQSVAALFRTARARGAPIWPVRPR